MTKLFHRLCLEVQYRRDQKKDSRQALDFWPHSFEKALNRGITLENLAENFRASFRESFFIKPGHRSQIIGWIRSVSPQAEALILTEAERVCAHQFDLLGSGAVPLGNEIDWHLDFKSGHRWNPTTYFKRIRPAAFPGGYDIKVPWELSRCQHFLRLGQAYWLTGNEKYAQEWIAQVFGWIQANPWPYGVNWASTMDVAIQSINWLWGLAFFLDSPYLTDEILCKILASLLQHSRHIRSNLEVYPNLTNNHYLSDLVGLIYSGILLPQFREAQEWRKFALVELEKEMFLQVYADGVDFEASISYHRLAAEIFLSAVLISQRNGYSFSGAFLARLEKMLEFTLYTTQPDGSVPLIGDNDNGRMFRLKVWQDPDREWVDHRYLLAIGAVLFNRQDFGQAAEDQWEEAIWMFGDHAFQTLHNVEKPPRGMDSHDYPTSGIYIFRNDDLYLCLDAGSNGQNGIGGHAHNDIFSFNLHADGQAWIIDPGTFTYTADYAARNESRTTASHNTVRVNEQEQNRLDPRVPFGMNDDAKVKVLCWEITGECILFRGCHTGYERLPNPATHLRTVFLDRKENVIIVSDDLTGSKNHLCESYLHFAPGLKTELIAPMLCRVKPLMPGPKSLVVLLSTPTTVEAKLENRWASLSYGSKIPIYRLSWSWSQHDDFCLAIDVGDDHSCLDLRVARARQRMKLSLERQIVREPLRVADV